MGSFVNDELGEYTRYSHTAADSEVIITLSDGRYVVVGGESAEDTRAIYDTIAQYVGG